MKDQVQYLYGILEKVYPKLQFVSLEVAAFLATVSAAILEEKSLKPDELTQYCTLIVSVFERVNREHEILSLSEAAQVHNALLFLVKLTNEKKKSLDKEVQVE